MGKSSGLKKTPLRGRKLKQQKKRKLEQKPIKKQAKLEVSTSADGQLLAKKGNVLQGHSKIVQKIGQGTFGAVYNVRDTQLNENIALKIFRSQPEQQQIGRIEIASVSRLARLQAQDQ